jgi:hypothetical protein
MTLSQEVTEAVNTLETIDMLPIDKAWVLLVFGGLKPTALLVLESGIWANGEAEKQIDPEKWQALQSVLEGFQLEYSTTTDVIGINKHMRTLSIFIAKDKKLLKKVVDAHAHDDEGSLGKLFGFPSTAVRAYLENTCLDPSELPESTADVSADEMRFLNHRLSISNWKEEIDYLPAYAKYVKKMSPIIYGQCVE